jgi:hypothetical protein
LGGTGASLFSSNNNLEKFFRNDTQFLYTAGVAYTGSYFVKGSSSGFAQMSFGTFTFGSGQYANFSLSGGGSVTQTAGSVVAQIFKLSNGWYRISLTAVCTASATAGAPVVVSIDNGTAIRIAVSTGAHSITAWGSNVVAQDFLSSYIDSGASASSRVGDVFRAPVGAENVMLGRNTFGVLARCDGLKQLAGGSNTLSVSTIFGAGNVSLIRNAASTYPYSGFASDTTSPTLFANLPSGNIATPFSIALTQDATGRANRANGGVLQTQSTFANLVNRIDLGERNGGSSPDYRGYKTVAFGPTRLSDAQLIALSGTL